MLLFKRILKSAHKYSGSERRGPVRHSVNPQFPIKVVLIIAGRDPVNQEIRTEEAAGLEWPARLLNLSIGGARVQVPAALAAHRHDPCHLRFEVKAHKLELLGHITYKENNGEFADYGIALDTPDIATLRAFEQLVLLIAFGASLHLTQPSAPDDMGYLFERYDGIRSCYLRVWRSSENQQVFAFEFALLDCMVRGQLDDSGVRCLLGTELATARTATPAQKAEIKRLFQWVVLNLAPGVAADVREFLLQRAV